MIKKIRNGYVQLYMCKPLNFIVDRIELSDGLEFKVEKIVYEITISSIKDITHWFDCKINSVDMILIIRNNQFNDNTTGRERGIEFKSERLNSIEEASKIVYEFAKKKKLLSSFKNTILLPNFEKHKKIK